MTEKVRVYVSTGCMVVPEKLKKMMCFIFKKNDRRTAKTKASQLPNWKWLNGRNRTYICLACTSRNTLRIEVSFFQEVVRVAPAAERREYIYCSVPSGKSNFNLAMEDTRPIPRFWIVKYESRHIHGGFSSHPLWL